MDPRMASKEYKHADATIMIVWGKGGAHASDLYKSDWMLHFSAI